MAAPLLLVALALSLAAAATPAKFPNLVFLLVDDMGYHSPQYINPEVITPHIDALAAAGVATAAHTYKFCSPTRAAFLTGRFPWRISSTLCPGEVCNYLPAHIPMGVHTGYSMLPQRLAEKGYISYHAGKWHEGLYAPQFTPLYRGFNFSNGFLSGGEDHYTLAADLGVGNCGVPGGLPVRDAFIDNATAPQAVGTYTATRFADAAVDYIARHPPSAPLFLYLALHNTHAPLEAEPQDLALYPNITWHAQRTYYAMMSAVDRTVGRVTAALKAAGLWDNTILAWTSDNGAPVQVGGSNGPLRGGKGSNWEGGVRVPAIFSGGLIPPARRGVTLPRAAGALHIADLHATFLARAGLPLQDPNPRAPAPVDGLDVWDWVLGAAAQSPRALQGLPLDHLNFDAAARGVTGALIQGDLKLIVGGPGGEVQAAWFGGPPDYFTPNRSGAPPINQTACSNARAPYGCLFNLTADPNEHSDLAATHPALMAAMLARFQALNASYHPPLIVPPSEEAQLCAVAARNQNVAAPWRAAPLPQDA